MTLIELLITMAVLILIATLCMPKYKIEKYQVDSFAHQLCSDIRYVRRSNMLENKNTNITQVDNNGQTGYSLRKNGEYVKTVYLPKGMKFKRYGLDKVIKFRNDGSPMPTGGTLRIFNEKINIEITIVPVSGRVLLKEGEYGG